MNIFKLNGIQKFASLVLVIVLVIATVGFAADGWHLDSILQNGNKNPQKNEDPGEKEEIPNEDVLEDNSSDTVGDQEPDAPIYINVATGLQVSEAEYNSSPIGIYNYPDRG